MTEARTKRIYCSLLLSAIVLGSMTQLNAEMILFSNGRTMSVKDYLVAGDMVTVTFRNGGVASFAKSLIARIDPDEVPEPVEEAPAVANQATGAAISPLDAQPFAQLIETVALRHGVDPALVHAVVQAESNYHARAKSPMGARGLMQVMPTTARTFGIVNLYDPQSNLEAGVQYLKYLLGRFNLAQAIAAYNAGPNAVRKYRGIPPFPETQAYVRKVLENFRR